MTYSIGKVMWHRSVSLTKVPVRPLLDIFSIMAGHMAGLETSADWLDFLTAWYPQ